MKIRYHYKGNLYTEKYGLYVETGPWLQSSRGWSYFRDIQGGFQGNPEAGVAGSLCRRYGRVRPLYGRCLGVWRTPRTQARSGPRTPGQHGGHHRRAPHWKRTQWGQAQKSSQWAWFFVTIFLLVDLLVRRGIFNPDTYDMNILPFRCFGLTF